MKPGALRIRLAATAGIFFMLFIILVGRVLQLCVIDAPTLRLRASRQQRLRVALPPERGPIVDRHGDTLALTVESADVYIRPGKLNASADSIRRLAAALHLAPEFVGEKAAAPQPFVWLLRKATAEQADAVEALGLPGVGSKPARRRFYPRGPLAAHVLGFAGVDSQGLEGIELAYDRDLRGSAESFNVSRDARGGRMLMEGDWQPLPRRGARVELTLDTQLQQVAESELAAAVTASRAAAGVAMVMDPWTGEVLALAGVPSFDPNDVAAASAGRWRNRAIADSYEPGSTFKGIVAAAAIEAGVVGGDEPIFCEYGSFATGKRVVHDHEPYGWLTFADVVKHSSNIGMAKIGERLGAERLGTAIEKFGFGERSGIDLPGEVAGIVRPFHQWSRINLATTSFGQGIAVTPIQLLRAYAAIANGGHLMRPYVVRRVLSADGAVLRENRPVIVRQAVSATTARVVTEFLRGVVEEGTGTKARIEGISVAGKTGTAQKVDSRTGRYSARDRIASFVGFVPAEVPRFVILVVIDSPRTATYGGVVAAPVFRRIAEYAVDRLGLRIAAVPPLPLERDAASPPVKRWAASTVELGMPSFLGLSMREALIRAARAGWEIRTRGSGFVIAQDPPPGAQTADGKRLDLQFGSGAS